MRTLAIIAWLFAGLGGTIYHFGPGQDQLELDRIHAELQKARQHVIDENYQTAILKFDQVMADLPQAQAAIAQRARLEKAKAQMLAEKLPEARAELQVMLDDLRGDESADPALVTDVQATLAHAQYYMTWLMRLEGLPEEEWKPEIEAARQHFTAVHRKATADGNTKLETRSEQDLESTIRLARMELSELQALPLPCQCNCNCSGNKPSRKKGTKKKKKPGSGGGQLEVPEGYGS